MPEAQTTLEQAAIRAAIIAANPDEEGSLMRELDARGVGDLVRNQLRAIDRSRPMRRRYVPGWRP